MDTLDTDILISCLTSADDPFYHDRKCTSQFRTSQNNYRQNNFYYFA